LNVNLNAEGEICDLRHTLGDSGVMSCLFTGIYIVEKSFLRRLRAGHIESVITVLIAMIREQPGSVAGIIIDEGSWYDIGSAAEYEKINALLAGSGQRNDS
jgi:NDP-sugar pyrophosphorylase family protein